jgi:hypothetical protein
MNRPRTETAINRASESDRLWFEKHPGVDTRTRPYIPGEFTPPGEDDPLPSLPDDQTSILVDVVQVRPGQRVRTLEPGQIVYFEGQP